MEVKQSLQNILTTEEKKYLRSYTRYLRSFGMRDGLVEIDFSDGFGEISDIDWNEITSFSNNFKVDITDELTDIFKKIFDFIDEENLLPELDTGDSDINYRRLEIEIDGMNQKISVSDYYTYYDMSETESTEFYDEEDEEEKSIEPLFDSIEEEIKREGGNYSFLTLPFQGGGDSGYIEDNFDEGFGVPSQVENWCYRQLENRYGGWEINEGSQGEFHFDMKTKTIHLNFTANVEKDETNTIFEESFVK